MGKRPVSITVMAILGIVWSAINLLMLCASPLLIALQWNSPQPAAQLYHDTTFLTITIINYLINLPMHLLLLASSIGCLKLRPWARTGMMVFGGVYILTLIFGTVANVVYIVPKTNAAMLAAMPPGGINMRPLLIIGQIVGLCFTLLFLAYPISIFYVFTRTKVVNAFKGVFEPSPNDLPVEFPQNPPPA